MFGFWASLIFLFFIVFLATSIWFGYARAVDMVGREAAQRNLRHTLPNILLSWFALALVASLLGTYGWGTYAWVTFNILGSVGCSVLLLNWFFHKKEFGSLLINTGRTSSNKFVFWFAVFYTLSAISKTWGMFVQVLGELPPSTNLEVLISEFVFHWVLAIYLLALALSRLEFRENGICFMLTFLKWQRVNSYKWEQSKPNILTIWFKPRFPLVPGFLSMPIPTKHREAVNQTLDERLPGKNL
jgi:hypothetical protein